MIFLDHRGIALGHLVHLVDCGIDLGDTGCLFTGRGGDGFDRSRNLTDLRSDIADCLASLVDERNATLDLRDRSFDQILDLLGRLCRAPGQIADFLRDDGKSLASLSGTRRLDPGIEREQVRLESDFVDHLEDVCDLARRFLDQPHRFYRACNHCARMIGPLPRIGDQLAGICRHRAGALDRRGDFIECSSSFLE